MMFHRMPFILAAVILVITFVGDYIPLEIKEFFYGISLSIKSMIVFLLPIIIFSLLFKTAVSLSSKATKIILLILVCVCLSNFTSTFLSHFIGMWIYHFDMSLVVPKDNNALTAFWVLDIPKIIPNDKAMFAGIILGILMLKWKPDVAQKISYQCEKLTSILLNSFGYFIPLFVFGFILKLQFDGVMVTIVKDYTFIFAIIALAQMGYILLMYLVLNQFNLRFALENLKNMLPAAITGFSTMSSAAAMPLTIVGTEKNTLNKDVAKAVIPSTVNIHLVGDCFAIPIFAYAILKNYGIEEPSLISYLIFSFYFVLAKFSVAAIPGGGIIVMLPILESYMGFNADMMSLITALYILFDPVITCTNVLGNGGFAKMIDKILLFKKRREEWI